MDKKPSVFKRMLLRGAITHNPVLIQLVGLCPVVAVSRDVKTALLMSAVFFVQLLLTQMIACFFLKKVPRFLRICIYMLLGLAIICPIIVYIDRYDSAIRLGAGMYLALLAVNSVAAFHCEKLAVKAKPSIAFYDVLATALGFAVVFVLVAALREWIGRGSILGYSVPVPLQLPAILLPFGGFLILAFLAAGLQALIHRFYPQEAQATQLRVSRTVVTLRAQGEQAEKPSEDVLAVQEDAAAAPVTLPPTAQLQLPGEEEPAETPEGPQQEAVPEKAQSAPQSDIVEKLIRDEEFQQEFAKILQDLEDINKE